MIGKSVVKIGAFGELDFKSQVVAMIDEVCLHMYTVISVSCICVYYIIYCTCFSLSYIYIYILYSDVI